MVVSNIILALEKLHDYLAMLQIVVLYMVTCGIYIYLCCQKADQKEKKNLSRKCYELGDAAAISAPLANLAALSSHVLPWIMMAIFKSERIQTLNL